MCLLLLFEIFLELISLGFSLQDLMMKAILFLFQLAIGLR